MKRLNKAEAIANVVGWDIQDVKECLYQYGKTSATIYSIGNNYYCAQKNKPKESEDRWNWRLIKNNINDNYGWNVWISTN